MPKISVTEQDFQLSAYNFELPEELIAQEPSPQRGADRLYVLDRANPDATSDLLVEFADLPNLLPPNSLLIANNSKVAPARIISRRPTGGVLEVLLLTPPPLIESAAVKDGAEYRSNAQALLRPAKKIKIGERYELAPGLAMQVLEKLEFGQANIELFWNIDNPSDDSPSRCSRPQGLPASDGTAEQPQIGLQAPTAALSSKDGFSSLGALSRLISLNGELPLPPYIKRKPSAEDAERYQTIYADDGKAGSLAAPTAGLHFTPELKQRLLDAGHEWAELTLFVGYGTFSPVRCPDIRDHEMHAEYVELSQETVRAILKAKREGRPVFAVGTTSARVLEGVAAELAAQFNDDSAGQFTPGKTDCSSDQASQSIPTISPQRVNGVGEATVEFQSAEGNESAAPTGQSATNHPLLLPKTGWLNCFIYPGKPIRVIDGLITNFHLPESSLLMLVSALTGRERMLSAYERAIAKRFRFFSYGDAMLIK